MKELLAVVLTFSSCGSVVAQVSTPTITDQTIDRITRQETEIVASFAAYTPIAETYLQELRPHGGSLTPYRDQYFLSQAKLGPDVDELPFKGVRKGSSIGHFAKSNLSAKMEYLPEGFAQMSHPNMWDFDRDHYAFKYTDSEADRDVDCLVFEVSPLIKYSKQRGMFKGQIWVESKSYTIVRYKGVFTGGNDIKGHYFHFDSFRSQMQPGLWLPSHVYAEETDYAYNKVASVALGHARFRAETYFWGYGPVVVDAEPRSQSEPDRASGGQPHTMSSVLLTTGRPQEVRLQTEAENAVTVRLEQLGLLAAPNALDRTLEGIMEKLQTANHVRFQPEARCRELLTSRLEFFTVGHTIVISRGLIDVANDEAILASVIALGLARIELTAPDNLRAYQGNFDPRDALVKLNFASPAKSKKKIQELATDYIASSPYKNSMPVIREFFGELTRRAAHIPAIVVANLGDNLLAETVYSWAGTELEMSRSSQDRALPLAIKTRIDPWSDRIELVATPTNANSANDNSAFGLAPLFPPRKQQH